MTKINKNIVTIDQIAQAAKVSSSTVSRVLNGNENVSEQTRAKVLYQINKQGYQPNAAAQSLAGKPLQTLALFLPYGFANAEDVFMVDDIACFQQVNAIIAAAAGRGYKLIATIVDNPDDPEQQALVRRTFYQNMVDAGIFIEFDDECPIIEEMIGKGFIVGVLDQNPQGRNEHNRILFNYVGDQIGMQTVAYLYGLGHRSIAVLAGPSNKYSGEERLQGVLQGFKIFGLDPLWVRRVDFGARFGYDEMGRVLRQGGKLPTAIICGNDAIAFGAIEALRKESFSVPDDISVIGVDDHILAPYFSPQLTTFRMNFIDLLMDMTHRVIDAIDAMPEKSCEYRYNYSFVERESCARPGTEAADE